MPLPKFLKQKKLVKKTSTLFVLYLTMLTSAGAAITVYQTTGSHGEVKFSQFAPTDGKPYKVIQVRSGGGQIDPGQLANQTETSKSAAQTAEELRIAELEQQVKQQQDKELAQRCQSLSNNLSNLNSGGRIYEPDGRGGRRYLDNREIEIKRDNIQKMINQYCLGAN